MIGAQEVLVLVTHSCDMLVNEIAREEIEN